MNILQIYHTNLDKISKEFLDELTREGSNMGKKENNYWMINHNVYVQTSDPRFNDETNAMNTLIQISTQKGFTNTMIIDR